MWIRDLQGHLSSPNAGKFDDGRYLPLVRGKHHRARQISVFSYQLFTLLRPDQFKQNRHWSTSLMPEVI